MVHRNLNRKCQFIGGTTHLRNAIYREKSLLDDFYTEEIVSSVTGSKCIRHVDPLHSILNQKRLDNLGADSISALIKDMNANLIATDSLQELRKKCSDDDLLATIKSRKIQTLSELKSWSDYMSNNQDKFVKQINEVVSELTENSESSSTQSDNTSNT